MSIEIIAKIIDRDRVFGKLINEAQDSYEQGKYFSALACLFISTEQAVKFIVESQFVNFEAEALQKGEKYWPFWKYMKFAEENKLLSQDEKQLVMSFFSLRNNIFHANLYPTGVEINGKFCSLSEDETLEMFYVEFSPKIFNLILVSITH